MQSCTHIGRKTTPTLTLALTHPHPHLVSTHIHAAHFPLLAGPAPPHPNQSTPSNPPTSRASLDSGRRRTHTHTRQAQREAPRWHGGGGGGGSSLANAAMVVRGLGRAFLCLSVCLSRQLPILLIHADPRACGRLQRRRHRARPAARPARAARCVRTMQALFLVSNLF